MGQMNVEQAISMAADSKNDKDYFAFFDLAKSVEFFFNYDETGGQMTIPLFNVGGEKRSVIFYSSKEGAASRGKYAGIIWEKGLEMVARMPVADGLVVQNENQDWIAIMRDKIIELLARVE